MEGENKHSDHSYALDLLDMVRHISQVEKGRKGYFCPGCRQEMIARKGDIKTHHFAHDPRDTAHRGKCTYSNETTRHKVGKEILQRLKLIKVPSLRKFPDEGKIGLPQIVRESWTVEADSVAIEIPFYENEDGQIIWGKNLEWKTDTEKFLLIQPDVIFFDAAGKPILLIELVATHKIGNDKYLKIRNLGIDTIQVSLPDGPSTELEDTFRKTARTKWVYNYERENTEYKQVPPRTGQEVSLSDEFEEGLVNYETTYECKVFEINGAIRRFRRYLESEQFRSVRESIIKEIRRTEKNTTRYRKQWGELQETIDGEVSAGFESESARLDERYDDLERRYRNKDRELSEEEECLRADEESLSKEARTYRAPSQYRVDALKKRIRELGGDTTPIQVRIGNLRKDEEAYRQSIKSDEIDIDRESETIAGEISAIEKEIINLEFETSGLSEEYAAIERRIRAENKSTEEDLRATFDRDRDLSIGAIKDRDFRRTHRLHRRIKELIEGGEYLGTIPYLADRERKLRKARKEIDQGSYKAWI